jgi:hypothetical protein
MAFIWSRSIATGYYVLIGVFWPCSFAIFLGSCWLFAHETCFQRRSHAAVAAAHVPVVSTVGNSQQHSGQHGPASPKLFVARSSAPALPAAPKQQQKGGVLQLYIRYSLYFSATMQLVSLRCVLLYSVLFVAAHRTHSARSRLVACTLMRPVVARPSSTGPIPSRSAG